MPLADAEQTWSDELRGVIYGVAMVYCFMGVSIVADNFMDSIQAITSRRRKVTLKSGEVRTVQVWNEVVANLSLMALGSSAPEIFLSVVELFRNRMFSGDLGGATIVGSAAFNLFVIVAVCIGCIPGDEARKIEGVQVYYVTAVFSLVAYLWLVVVLVLVTPDVIDIPEALITLLFLPILVWASYKVDVGWMNSFSATLPAARRSLTMSTPDQEAGATSPAHPHRTSRRISVISRASTVTSKSSWSGDCRIIRRPSVGAYKAQIVGKFTGAASRRSFSAQALGGRSMSGMSATSSASSSMARGEEEDQSDASEKSYVQLLADHQSMSVSLAKKPITVVRSGHPGSAITVQYSVHLCDQFSQTGGGAADDETNKTKFSFNPSPLKKGNFLIGVGDLQKEVEVTRPLADNGTPQEFIFFLSKVWLTASSMGHGETTMKDVEVGDIPAAKVAVDADGPGYLCFADESLDVEAKPTAQTITVTVLRKGGCIDDIECGYRTEAFTAVPDFDFVGQSGLLTFAEGVTEQTVTLTVCGKRRGRVGDAFLLILEPSEDCEEVVFDEEKDGGTDSAILTINIKPLAEEGPRWVQRIDSVVNIESIRKGNEDWLAQFPAAWFCLGSREEQQTASAMDWILHLMALPWKLLYTLIPPATFCGGWVCFYACLVHIALVTAMLADLAELFGCVCGMPDFVTAIAIVALGTSMPDLFASKSAAIGDPAADASIVNVTGSNSVNVFLGLGVPWTIGSLYWLVKGRTPEWEMRYGDIAERYGGLGSGGPAVFVLYADGLGFGVIIFSALCCLSLMLLFARRRLLGAELGGPLVPKVATVVAFFLFWVAYIALASWNAMNAERVSNTDRALAAASGLGAVSLCALAALGTLARHRVEMGSEGGSDEGPRPSVTPATSEASGNRESPRSCVSGEEHTPGGFPKPEEQPESLPRPFREQLPVERDNPFVPDIPSIRIHL